MRHDLCFGGVLVCVIIAIVQLALSPFKVG
jgi:hypothetical protein